MAFKISVYIYLPLNSWVIWRLFSCIAGCRDTKRAGGVGGPTFSSNNFLSNIFSSWNLYRTIHELFLHASSKKHSWCSYDKIIWKFRLMLDFCIRASQKSVNWSDLGLAWRNGGLVSLYYSQQRYYYIFLNNKYIK